jgi:thiol-disulfide isomerase/thioredoxin
MNGSPVKTNAISAMAVLGSILWAWSLVSSPGLAQDKSSLAEAKTLDAPVVEDQKSTATPELQATAEALVLALNQKEVDKAFLVMTAQGADQYLGMMLMQIVQAAAMEAEGEPNEDFAQLKKLLSKYGLDKVEIQIPMPNGSGDPEKMTDEIVGSLQKTEERLLACIPNGERLAVTKELLDCYSKIIFSPIGFGIGQFELDGDRAELQVVAEFPPELASEQEAQDAMGQMPIAYALFVNSEGRWLFDGFNNRRLIKEIMDLESLQMEPFKEIEGLAIEGKTIDDREVSLESYKGKVVLVDFWGTWCGPCVAGIPKLAELHEKYKAQGFEILGVAADDAETLKDFLDKKPMAWENVTDADSELATKYSIQAYPTTLLVDKQGKHVASNLHGETLEKAIELLLAGKSIASITGSANDLLEAGKKRAAEEKKFIFLHFGADWCGPCKILEKWIAKPEIQEMFDKVFVDVKIDVDHNFGAQELMNAYSPNAGGIPWFGILTPTDEKPLATCEDKEGNIGIPDSEEGFDHFAKMFEGTGKFSKEQLELLRSSMAAAVEQYKSGTEN